MKFISTSLPGVVIIAPDVFRDGRGFFLETYHLQKYRDDGIPRPLCRIISRARSIAPFAGCMHNSDGRKGS
jgi:dTDP-4-dehydrorhamnose 3,5-epimerase-like enzyme